MSSSPKHITFNDALEKARHYCAYQERCHFEVETKLRDWGLHYEFIPNVCVELSNEGYLNEERFVSAYARGKFNQNNWGKIKIAQGLKLKKLSAKMIEIGLNEIKPEAYFDKLEALLTRKEKSVKAKNKYEKRNKLYAFALGKGYESHFINDILERVLDESD